MGANPGRIGGIDPLNNLVVSSQYILWKWKISHTSQSSSQYRTMINFAKLSPPISQNGQFRYSFAPKHSFAPLSIKRDFGYFFQILFYRPENFVYSSVYR